MTYTLARDTHAYTCTASAQLELEHKKCRAHLLFDTICPFSEGGPGRMIAEVGDWHLHDLRQRRLGRRLGRLGRLLRLHMRPELRAVALDVPLLKAEEALLGRLLRRAVRNHVPLLTAVEAPAPPRRLLGRGN